MSSGKHVHEMYTPHIPLLCRKIGVYRGVPIVLIFDPKHRLWVLVRTALARRFKRVPTIYVMSKNKKKKNQYFSNKKKSIFDAENSLYIA